jgi:hypothetical protein
MADFSLGVHHRLPILMAGFGPEEGIPRPAVQAAVRIIPDSHNLLS